MTAKKRRIVDENGKYSEKWEEKYFFIVQDTKLLCLIFGDIVAVFKEYNGKRLLRNKTRII